MINVKGLKNCEVFQSFCLFTAALWRGALPAVQSKELLMKQFFLIISFSAKRAKENGQRILYITERCVFKLSILKYNGIMSKIKSGDKQDVCSRGMAPMFIKW